MTAGLPAPRRPREIPPWTWIASILAHGAACVGFAWFALASYHGRTDSDSRAETMLEEREVLLELTPPSDGRLVVDAVRDPEGIPPTPSGGSKVPRLDTGKNGRGGDGKVPAPAQHLADRDEALLASPDLLSHLDTSQHQRLKTGPLRATYEDRRATTHPMELIFLASGDGQRAERRSPSETNPKRGALLAEDPSTLGGELGAKRAAEARDEKSDGEPGGMVGPSVRFEGRAGASKEGRLLASPGVGLDHVDPGDDHRASADVMHARPDVTESSVTIPASDRGKPADDVDSDQRVATAVQALVHASTAGGAQGDGVGGTAGGGDPGAGAQSGAGSHPLPMGAGDGDWFDLNSNDPKLFDYFRRIHRKIDPLWRHAFPRSAVIELKQGTVILEFTIAKDGRLQVSWPPFRASGIDEFDRNCADALRRASPLPPIPPELGRDSLRVRAPFVASNPIIK